MKKKPDQDLLEDFYMDHWLSFRKAFKRVADSGADACFLFARVAALVDVLEALAKANKEHAPAFVQLAATITAKAMPMMGDADTRLRADSESQIWFPWLKSAIGDAPGWEVAAKKLNASGRIVRKNTRSQVEALATLTVANMVADIESFRAIEMNREQVNRLRGTYRASWRKLPPLSTATAKLWFDRALKFLVENEFQHIENTPYARNLRARFDTRGQRLNQWRRDCLQALRGLAPCISSGPI